MASSEVSNFCVAYSLLLAMFGDRRLKSSFDCFMLTDSLATSCFPIR